MTRYLLVSSHYAPLYQFGGPVRLAQQYIAVLDHADISHRVLTLATAQELRDSGAPAAQTDSDSVSRLAIDRRSRIGMIGSIARAAMASWRHFDTAPQAVLHICEYRAPLTIGAVLALALRQRLRPTLNARILHSAFGQLQHPNHPAKRLYDGVFRWLTKSLPYTVFAQNQHEYELSEAFFAHQRDLTITLLPLSSGGDPAMTGGSDCLADTVDNDDESDWQRLRQRRKAARLALDIDEHRQVLIFLGRWVPEKGIERLMRAVAQLPTEPVLLVAGADFGIGPALRALAQELGLAGRVRFLENISDRRFELYAAADVFTALPIIFEETMLASVEALSVGTPILVSLVSREADIPYVAETGAGAVIDFDQAQFEAALRRLTDSAPDAQRAARETYRRYFSGQELRDRLLESVATPAER